MSYNSTCIVCGSKGYQGFVDFECSNSKCEKFPKTVIINKSPSPGPTTFNQVVVAKGWTSKISSLSDQQDVAMDFLRKVLDGDGVNKPTYGTPGVIAGGAPRDWEFGKLARDIDIFVEDFDDIAFRKAFPHLTLTEKSNAKGTLYYGISFHVWDVKYGGLDFQIIKCPPGVTYKEYVDTFDFGINKIWVDRNGLICPTSAYVYDKQNQTLTVNVATLHQATWKLLGKRTAKMKTKFPNWKIDII